MPTLLLLALLSAQAAETPHAVVTHDRSTRVQTIGVFSINVSGLDPEVRNSAIDAVATAVAEIPGYKSISRNELEAMLSAELIKDQLGCDDVACLAEIGAAAGVSRIIAGSVSVVEGSLLVSLQLTNTEYVNVENRVTLSWDGPQASLNDVLATATERLVIPGNRRQPGNLRVTGIPEGAGLLVDGSPRAVAPADVTGLAIGVHTLQVEAEGFEPFQQPFVVRSGKMTQLNIMLNKQTPIYRTWWFWTATGVAVAGGATATALILTSDSGKTTTVTEEQRTGIDFQMRNPTK